MPSINNKGGFMVFKPKENKKINQQKQKISVRDKADNYRKPTMPAKAKHRNSDKN